MAQLIKAATRDRVNVLSESEFLVKYHSKIPNRSAESEKGKLGREGTQIKFCKVLSGAKPDKCVLEEFSRSRFDDIQPPRESIEV